MGNLKVLLKTVDFFFWVEGECQIRKSFATITAYYVLGKTLRTFYALSHLILDNNPMM